MKLITYLTAAVIVLTALIIIFTLPVLAVDTNNGARIFQENCAGCHANGGNIIRRGKNLKKAALKKYQVDSLAAISYLVANGKNNMSAYQDRLHDREIKDVAAYVLEQAENNWKK